MRITRRHPVPAILRLYYKIKITIYVSARNLLDGRKEMVPEHITSPSDIKKLSIHDLKELSAILQQKVITNRVSHNGSYHDRGALCGLSAGIKAHT
jgi:hypothetical protein